MQPIFKIIYYSYPYTMTKKTKNIYDKTTTTTTTTAATVAVVVVVVVVLLLLFVLLLRVFIIL